MPAINKLTDQKCKAAKPGPKPKKLSDGHGLFLYVTPAGAKVWRMAYKSAGKEQTATFGPYPLISLAEARIKRDEARRALLLGASVKPVPKKDAITLAAACAQYWAGRNDVSDLYRSKALSALENHVLPTLGGRTVQSLTRADLMGVLNVMDAAKLYVYVRKTRMWLGQVLDWCVEHEHAEVNHCASINTKKAFGNAPVESFAALELTEVPEFMQRLEFEGVIQSAVATKLLALTWVRTQELRMMQWDEINGDLWLIPAGKMKRGRDHLVPLSKQSLELLAHMKARSKGGPYVFPNDRRLDRPASENAILYLIHRMGYKGRMTGHGFRSVGSTWANELELNSDAIEMQLSHFKGGVREVYNRAKYLPTRKTMMQAWADWLMPPPAAAPI